MNKANLRRLAPFGLYLSGIAVLVSAGLYIVYRTFDLPLQISLGAIVLGLALFVILDPTRARQALTGRQARYGSNALLLALAFIGIVAVINYLVYNNSRQWDLTEDQSNSLAPESVETLNSISAPVHAEAYYSSRMPSETAVTLLENYQRNSDGKFDFEVIDPETNPVKAQQANITRDGTIVLRMDDRQEQVTFASEEEITGALVRLANPGERAVYFLTGHGEAGLDTNSENNYSYVQNSLTAKNYTVSTLNLLTNPTVPGDALAVIVPGPTKPVSDEEAALLKDYVNRGGSLIYLAEPRPVTEFGEAADPLAAYLESDWGILLDENVVIDPNPATNQPLLAISEQFATHAITQKMYTLVVILPSARSVRAGQAPEGVELTELAYSSNLAWGETDIQSIEQNAVKADEGQDVMGPFSLAVAGQNSQTGGRVLVVGDSDFASANAFANYGNSDFILNGIDWAAEQENLISLTPRSATQRYMVAPDGVMLGLILLGSVFVLPGLVILTGVIVWAQRRRKG